MGFAMPEYEIANEKSADKMFEELGYEKIIGNKRISTYLLKYYKNNDNVIYFSNTWGNGVHKGGEYSEFCDDITMQELKAINKKVVELGWIEKEN